MPELPEVETVKESLKQLILNRTIKDISINYNKILKNKTDDEFKKLLIGKTFLNVLRKGKFLIFCLDDLLMVSHLRMEGKYFLKTNEEISKHEHIIFHFTDGTNLRYHDVRKFGTIHIFETTKLENILKVPPLSNVGYDPLDDKLDVEYLITRFSKINKAIKTTLLDQSIISGLGNIYVDEVCFMSNIHPNTITKTLSRVEIQSLIDNSKIVLNKAISLGGTTIKSFVSSHAATGLFQNELLVHTKKNCPTCGTMITKIRVGGRGTYYCTVCQTMDKNGKID